MWIYVIDQLDTDSSSIHSAYVSEDKAKSVVKKLNEEEKEKLRLYNKWATNGEEDEECPDFGDYTYFYDKVWLTY